jgi:hypothetical protein
VLKAAHSFNMLRRTWRDSRTERAATSGGSQHGESFAQSYYEKPRAARLSDGRSGIAARCTAPPASTAVGRRAAPGAASKQSGEEAHARRGRGRALLVSRGSETFVGSRRGGVAVVTGVLVELFVEELPPKALKRLGEAFAEGIASGLRERGFLKPDSVTTAFASPRRLGAHITGVHPVAASREIPAQTLMPAAIGLDAGGRPTPPLLKKLRSRFDESVDLDQVLRERRHHRG